MMTTTEEKINELFDELVPAVGKAETEAGEIIRAFCRINYRFYNDGDKIGVDYGNETCNASARYLINHCDAPIKKEVRKLWGEFFDDTYENGLDVLAELIVEFIEKHPELKQNATEDMFDWTADEDRDWYGEDDDEDDYYSIY